MTGQTGACEVKESLDVFEARRTVQDFCERLGFSRRATLEMVLVASELCTNILKYGVRGTLELRPLRDAERGLGVELVARDEGPQFRDLATALQDGCDDRGPIPASAVMERGGLGTGLGAILRFSDALSVEPSAIGKRIVVRKYLMRRGSE